MRVLVTGAAGYIGSVVTEKLIMHGHQVVALDDLRHGHEASLSPEAQFIRADITDERSITQVLQDNPVEAVVHLAAEALIDESLRDPGRFFGVNTSGGLNLLEAMIGTGVRRLIFSSTAAVYGEPRSVPISEDAPLLPVNSYGESKLAFERMLPWYRAAYGLSYATLRYFNACGATPDHGEFHVPETHLIPIVFEVAMGKRDAISLFGTDYDTPDGTCIRDYIHVSDIAQAHVLALDAVDRIGGEAYNMGNGSGYSNLEVIEAVRRVTGREITVVPGPRRPGDPARLVATGEKIREQLGWEPEFPDLETMVKSAWAWHQQHPQGYAA